MSKKTKISNAPSPEGPEGRKPEFNTPSNDDADMMRDIGGAVDRQRTDAAKNEPEFFPLEAQLPPATPIPREAYGKLWEWADALSTLSRAPIEMSLPMVLAFVNLALQGRADINPFGRPTPISLYFLIVGPSGTGKSTAYAFLIEPLDDLLNRRWDELRAAQDSEERGRKNLTPPRFSTLPYTSDTTKEALQRLLSDSTGSVGILSDEAASFVHGYSMSKKNALDTCAVLCRLHDGATIVVHRQTCGDTYIVGKRLHFLLLGQWSIVRVLFENPLLREQGFLSRFLFCYPDSVMGRRAEANSSAKKRASKTLAEYRACMERWLDVPLEMREGTTNVLSPPCLLLSKQARTEFCAYDREAEKLIADFGSDAPQVDLINKSPSMALRIAATLQLADERTETLLQSEYVRRGVSIARYHLQESLRLHAPVHQSPHFTPAQMLLKHLKAKGQTSFTCSQLGKQGPYSLRTKDAHDPVIDFLVRNGWLISTEGPAPKRGGRKKTVYHLTSGALRELGMQ